MKKIIRMIIRWAMGGNIMLVDPSDLEQKIKEVLHGQLQQPEIRLKVLQILEGALERQFRRSRQ